ncbi:MAG TPA: hypothetical protein VLE43_18830 [Candidatus Saccharimonadia bacterium]|nr:hypothetical protein [Candidatus Saccharimonadia bacterium]
MRRKFDMARWTGRLLLMATVCGMVVSCVDGYPPLPPPPHEVLGLPSPPPPHRVLGLPRPPLPPLPGTY